MDSSPMDTSSEDKENYEDMDTQELTDMIVEGGLSQTTKYEICGIFIEKAHEKNAEIAKLKKVIEIAKQPSASVVPTSRLKAIREEIKRRIIYDGNDASLVQDPRFIAAMCSLKKTPITVVYKKVTITALWDKERSRLGYHDPTPLGPKIHGVWNYKCQVHSCWVDETSPIWNYCISHSDNVVYTVRDTKADIITIAIISPHTPRINGYTNQDLEKYSKSAGCESHLPALSNYVASNKEDFESYLKKIKTARAAHAFEEVKLAVFRKLPDLDLVYFTADILAGHGNHHNLVAMSLMIMMNNSVCSYQNNIKLINQEVYFRTREGFQTGFFQKLGEVLKTNGFIFKLTGKKKSTTVVPKSLLPAISYDKLPSSYLAKDEEEGDMYSGVKWGFTTGKRGVSTRHRKMKKTGLSDFDLDQVIRVFQYNHPQIDLLKGKKTVNKLNKKEKVIFEEMKAQAQRVETLGHSATLIANLLGVTFHGKPINFLCQKFTHFDDAWSKSLFEDMFGHLFGEGIEIEIPKSVKHQSGNLKWKLVK